MSKIHYDWSKKLQLGQLLASQGRTSDAKEQFAQVLEQQPYCYKALIWQASLFRKDGNLAEACCLAERAISVEPTDAAGHALLGGCLENCGRHRESVECYLNAISLGPSEAALHLQIARPLRALGRERAAEAHLRIALSLDPRSAESAIGLAQVLAGRGSSSEAAKYFEQAYRIEPSTRRGLVQLSRALLERGQTENAEKNLLKADALGAPNYQINILLATLYRQLGRFEEAIARLKMAAAINPLLPQAHCDLVYCQKTTKQNQGLVEALQRLARNENLSPFEQGQVQFALGKAADDLGNYAEATAHFDKANAILEGSRRLEESSSGAELELPLQDLSKLELHDLAKGGYLDGRPVFVVGMIRSGTTLLEQMLSRHPEVAGVGELDFWGEKTDNKNFVESRNGVRTSLASLGHEYAAILDSLAPGARRVVDKMPTNYRRIGAIYAALPKGKFIHVRRHPVDTCLSIFMTPNRAQLHYLHSKERIVAAYRSYQRAMEFWRSRLDAKDLLEVQYEDLVWDPEGTMKSVLAFLELPWSSDCLHPELNVGRVATPTQWQVRQPIFQSSVGKWKRYEPWLGPFAQLLSSSAAELGEPLEP